MFDCRGAHRVDFLGVECLIANSLSLITNALLFITHFFELLTNQGVTAAAFGIASCGLFEPRFFYAEQSRSLVHVKQDEMRCLKNKVRLFKL